ncbi:hypothetical protein [Nocardioides nitrophenolicus]|uniref:hypothetical protein n=1 Tax=Nocardioides nitrophenolicus TaxID=60489 RepID=UPI001956096F|nr:hypothetical protein [Nocardioides nitrophenolicus]MBM7518297.1 hypothetical protein [Nocardioides nitrophenolicus]
MSGEVQSTWVDGVTFTFRRCWVDGVEVPPRVATFNDRLVAVVDPEDHQVAERLVDAFFAQFETNDPADYTAERQAEAMQEAIRGLVAPPEPVEVFEHLVVGMPAPNGAVTGLCGKTWKPGRGGTVATQRCPECVAIIEAGWSK